MEWNGVKMSSKYNRNKALTNCSQLLKNTSGLLGIIRAYQLNCKDEEV